MVGLDEAGRGPLAGPVFAAAVMISPRLNQELLHLALKDSKKLSPKKREEFYDVLTKNSKVKWGLARVSEKIIDRINIKKASELAMERALKKLNPDFLLIDGNRISNSNLKSFNFKLIVKADEKVFSCAAASIIAKVKRDRLMSKYAKKFPKYGFDRHKGYGTDQHRKALKKHGSCQIHRQSFKPIKYLLRER